MHWSNNKVVWWSAGIVFHSYFSHPCTLAVGEVLLGTSALSDDADERRQQLLQVLSNYSL